MKTEESIAKSVIISYSGSSRNQRTLHFLSRLISTLSSFDQTRGARNCGIRDAFFQGQRLLLTVTFQRFCCSIVIMSHAAIWTGLSKDVFAGTVQLPQTGQTRCYGTNGNPVDCKGTGQDGVMLMGVPWPIPRFTDHKDGTITDNLTGLMWTRNAGTPGVGQCKGGGRDWEEAFVYVKCANSANYSGYSDWRVPNINELRSLANIGYNEQHDDFLSSWLQSQGFINVQLESYWASTQYVGDAVSAWCVYLWNGYTNYNYKIMDYYVWLVRDGEKTAPAPVFKTGHTESLYPGDDGDLHQGVAWPNPRFTDNGNGMVTDNLTGLIWLKNANCRDTVAGIPKIQGYLSWEQAITWTSNLASGDCGLSDGSTSGDWRLPNREELESLIDFGYLDPPLSNTAGTGHWSEGNPFSNVQKAFYWSSSTDFKAPYGQNGVTHWTGAWVVYMWNASVGSSKKTNMAFVWPVRGGDLPPQN